MTVIWPRLRACFRTPSHYKSQRQECDWVSRPVSPLRSLSVPPRPSSLLLSSVILSYCPPPLQYPGSPTPCFCPRPHPFVTFYLSFTPLFSASCTFVLPPSLQISEVVLHDSDKSLATSTISSILYFNNVAHPREPQAAALEDLVEPRF